MTKVSVVTVCYNSEKTIRRTIESVLKQTYTDYEYIIVDGASKDSTLTIVNEYSEAFGDKLRVISEPDDGMYFAINKGIKMANGELIGIINSDDWYEDDALEIMVNKYRENPQSYMVLYGLLKKYDEKDEWILMSIRSHNSLRSEMISHPSCFITKKLYDDIAVYDTKYRYVADYDLMLKLSEDKRVTFVPVFKLISNMKIGGISASGNAWLERVELQNHYGIIERTEYRKIMIKNRIHSLLR